MSPKPFDSKILNLKLDNLFTYGKKIVVVNLLSEVLRDKIFYRQIDTDN